MGMTPTVFAYITILVVALVVSSCGFYKYVYFISLGYGFSITALGIAQMLLFRQNLGLWTILLCSLFIIYGCRLGFYLLLREIKSSSYRSTMKKEIKDGSQVGFIAKVAIWVTSALLYTLQISPVFFRLKANAVSDGCAVAGVIVMAIGLVLESAADLQKSAAKKKNPNRFCDTGLFKLVRCPNYLGEVTFWTGVFVSGCTVYANAWQWAAALLGYLGIVYVMFGGARRLELRQNRNYGQDPEYQAYVKKTPVLLPFIPLYSVAKYKFLLG